MKLFISILVDLVWYARKDLKVKQMVTKKDFPDTDLFFDKPLQFFSTRGFFAWYCIIGKHFPRSMVIRQLDCIYSRPDYALLASSDEESDDENQVQEEPETPMQVIIR